MCAVACCALAGGGQTGPPASVRASDAEIAKASAATARQPDRADAWVRLGDALMQKGRETADVSYCGRAESAYRKALQIDPKCLEALVGMAWVSGVRHEFEASLDWAKKALALDPANAAAHGLSGDAAVEMGDYDRAYAEYQATLDVSPDLSSYSRSAHLLHLMGDTKRAAVLMMKAIEAGAPYAENTAWCRSQLALIYWSEGAYVPAEQVLAEGLKRSPDDYRLLAAMGKVRAAQKDYAAAIDLYRRSLEITPQQDVAAALGDLYMLTGKPDEAKKRYDLVETIARLAKANGVQGDLLTAKFYADHDRNLPEALKMAEEEYRTRKNVYAADVLAWCYYQNGRLEEAKRYIGIALAHNTPEAVFHFHKGMIYARAGDRTNAQLELYKALSTNPNFDPIQAPAAADMIQQLGSQPPRTQAER
jgi:tetratricopeptide (TPR) repeat protein